MGSIFKYIDDSLLPGGVEPDPCPNCDRGADAYLIDATPEQEEWDVYGPRVESLCVECIRSIPLRRLQPRDCEKKIQQLINAHFKKGTLTGAERHNRFVGICDEFRRTPQLPLFLQGEDWPYCCGDFSEFIGTPGSYEESIRIGREMSHWDHGPEDYESMYGEMTLEPEELKEVNIFRCLQCGNRVFTWQAT